MSTTSDGRVEHRYTGSDHFAASMGCWSRDPQKQYAYMRGCKEAYEILVGCGPFTPKERTPADAAREEAVANALKEAETMLRGCRSFVAGAGATMTVYDATLTACQAALKLLRPAAPADVQQAKGAAPRQEAQTIPSISDFVMGPAAAELNQRVMDQPTPPGEQAAKPAPRQDAPGDGMPPDGTRFLRRPGLQIYVPEFEWRNGLMHAIHDRDTATELLAPRPRVSLDSVRVDGDYIEVPPAESIAKVPSPTPPGEQAAKPDPAAVARLVEALENIARPHRCGCEVGTVCECAFSSVLSRRVEGMQSIAKEALAAFPSPPGEQAAKGERVPRTIAQVSIDRNDEWWMSKIESLGLLHSFREDGFERGVIQTPLGHVLISDGRVVREPATTATLRAEVERLRTIGKQFEADDKSVERVSADKMAALAAAVLPPKTGATSHEIIDMAIARLAERGAEGVDMTDARTLERAKVTAHRVPIGVAIRVGLGNAAIWKEIPASELHAALAEGGAR